MKANEFVKKFGWDEVKRVLNLSIHSSWADHYHIKEDAIGTAGARFSKKLCEKNDDFVCLHDLNQLIEAKELVEKFGGLPEAHKYIDDKILPELSRAIQLVESCQ